MAAPSRATRAAVGLGLAVTGVTVPSAPAWATGCERGEDRWSCSVTEPAPDPTTPPSSGGGEPEEEPTFHVALSQAPDGTPCWQIEMGGTSTWDEAQAELASFDNNGTLYDACPATPRTPPVPALWQSMSCPPPVPSPVTTNPDRTAAGMPTYLTIGGSNPVAVGCLGETITATARYVIQWGDGTTTETTSQGGSWADGGDVHHTYTDAGDVTIRVQAYWTGTWNGITFPELPVPTEATIPLGIDSYQSVRTR